MWEYLTTIRPKMTKGEFDLEYKKEYNKMYELMLNCYKNAFSIDELKNIITNEGIYSFITVTEGEEDLIDNDFFIHFKKSKFLSMTKFKRDLIDYFNNNNIYIKGPYKSTVNNKECWIIDCLNKKMT